MSPSYKVATGSVNGIAVSVYYTTADGNASLALTRNALSTFADAYGPYPWSTFVVAQAPAPNASAEWPSMTTIGEQYIAYKYVAVHEVAHQWWYAQVGDDQIRNPWLDEGFTEFSVRYFYGFGFSYDSTLPISLPATHWNASQFCCGHNTYGQTVYYRAAAMLNALRVSMGNTKFFQAMRDIQTKHHFGVVVPADVIAAFEARGTASKVDAILRSYGAM